MTQLRSLVHIVKGDFLQRTRTYAYLVTMCISLAVAYSFVPSNSDTYRTLTLVGYNGLYNSPWAGCVSAIMTSIFLSLSGYFLINSSIKYDLDTGVGLIIATSQVSNFKYLLSKFLANLLVLLTIMFVAFIAAIMIYKFRDSPYPLNLFSFIIPFVLVTFPSLVFISSLAVIAEVVFGRYVRMQSCCYFLLFISLIAIVQYSSSEYAVFLDPFGVKVVTKSVEDFVNLNYHQHIRDVSVGYLVNNQKGSRQFLWPGTTWTYLYLLSRLGWIVLSLTIIYTGALLFRRFDVRIRERRMSIEHPILYTSKLEHSIDLKKIPMPATSYQLMPLILTELLMLIRKPAWYLTGVVILWVSLFLAPLTFAHGYILPVLMFLQVFVWSELSSRERVYRVHYFTWSSFGPVKRLFTSQILAHLTWSVILAFPLIIRYLVTSDILTSAEILAGSIFIVLVAMLLGIMTGGKKMFEILFCVLTYALLQKIAIADYLGVLPEHSNFRYLAWLICSDFAALIVVYLVKIWEMRRVKL